MSPKYAAELREDRYLAIEARAWERELDENERDDADELDDAREFDDWCDDL